MTSYTGEIAKLPVRRKPNAAEKRLIAALRSGKFKQETYALRNPQTLGYCCLGVACVVSKLGRFRGGTFMGEEARLPIKVMKSLQWQVPSGMLVNPICNGQKSLLGLNDSGASFEDIANVIEKGYVQLTSKAD